MKILPLVRKFLKGIFIWKIIGQDSATKGIVLAYPGLDDGSGNVEVTLKCNQTGKKNTDVTFSVDSWENSTVKISGYSYYGNKREKIRLIIFVGCPLKARHFLEY